MSDLQIAGRLSVERAISTLGSRQPAGPQREGAVARVSTQREWRNRAVCRDEDPELFFPVGSDGPALAQTGRAKAVCAGCPVREECLSFALVAIPEGVAGGLSAGERRALRDQRRRARPGSPTTTVATGPEVAEQPGLLALPGVDRLVVTLLVTGQAVAGASRDERAVAAVVLHRAGRDPGWIATRLGVHDRQVRRWLERAEAGKRLNPGAVVA